MLHNYLKIAYRNLLKQKVFSFINIFGLTTGLICFLLIALYIFDELTYDEFHKKADSIYRVVETKTLAEGKETKVVPVAFNISEAAKREIPEVVDAARISMIGRANISNDENAHVFYEQLFLATASLFRIFDFPVVHGNADNALTMPRSVVLTDETAKKIFGREDVVGKVINMARDSLPYKITAVIHVPDNSHLKFNLLFSESSLYSSEGFIQFITKDWNSNTFVTYLQLSNNKIQVATKITKLVERNREDAKRAVSSFTLQPLKQIHFYSTGMEGNLDKPGNVSYLYIFGIVAFFVLLIACINYMNLTTARFTGRSKEIAVRKVAGASQKNLIKQFLTEASLMTVIALILALITVKLVLPYFNAFTEKQLKLGWQTDYRIWLVIVLTTVVVGLLSGIYPAFYQSRLKPYLLLKIKIEPEKSNLSIRRALVVFQFSLSIIMIVATLIVFQQMKYVESKDMGFNREQLLIVDINSGSVRRAAEAIKTEIGEIPSVKSVSVSSSVPGEWKVIPRVQVKAPARLTTTGDDVYYMAIDDQFLNTFGIKLEKGRNLSNTYISDSSAVLINETAAAMLGIAEPAEQVVEIPSVAFSGNASALDEPFRARVVGIVKDFNFQSLREKVAPMILAYHKNPIHNIDYFTLKIETDNLRETLKQIKGVIEKADQSHLFEYNFLDKQWELFYREDKKRQVVFLSVAVLTIFIACLGLFGLTTYAAERRIKEIGIRKVLGASVSSIVAMLSKDFLKLVCISALIAFPIAWWAMHQWLEDFAYRISISWWVFIIAGCAVLFIALLTVSFQAIKAALINPVKSLRTE